MDIKCNNVAASSTDTIPTKLAEEQQVKSEKQTEEFLSQYRDGVLVVIEQPGKYDILCDLNRSKCLHHVGNVRFRVICELHIPQYREALNKGRKSKKGKGQVFQNILMLIHNAGGHFLRKHHLMANKWIQVTMTQAKEKIGHQLRTAIQAQDDKKIPRTMYHVMRGAGQVCSREKEKTRAYLGMNIPTKLTAVTTGLPKASGFVSTSLLNLVNVERKTDKIVREEKVLVKDVATESRVHVEQYIMDKVNAKKKETQGLKEPADDEKKESEKRPPGPFDVICSRSTRAIYHEGNRRFLNLCHQKKWITRYINATTKGQKSKVINTIVSAVHETGGKFLGRKSAETDWEEISALQSKEKVGHTIRKAVALRDTAWVDWATNTLGIGGQLKKESNGEEEDLPDSRSTNAEEAQKDCLSYEGWHKSPLDLMAAIATQQIMEEKDKVEAPVNETGSEADLPAAKRNKVSDESDLPCNNAYLSDSIDKSSRDNRLSALLGALEGKSPPLLIHVGDPEPPHCQRQSSFHSTVRRDGRHTLQRAVL
eukprot:CAMPEP_0119017510 /NCGR_PEP_ID=MMETSP1176-20130426/16786_1 /TAXON_ID=265551 /ORGANISM="Synedropsis recta cf, Strain CCMP1620" /LENGTH=537 /DNA_ID=CAMNT_0006971247 /DNA_START=69 /DNA_END=1682 /DNA_ORIENTATION=+